VLALRIRDFRLLWTGQLLSSLGSWLLVIAVPYKVFELTGSPTATGFAFVTESVPAIVIGPIAGVAVDRWDRRRTMLAVSLGEGGCILPVAFVHQAGQVGIVYLALLAESALGQFYQPAEQALVPGLVGRAEALSSANALMSVGSAATRLAGASLGGIIFAALGLPTVVVIDACTYLASAGCVGLVRWRAAPERAIAGRGQRRLPLAAGGFGDGLRHVASSRPLRGLLAAAAAFLAGNGMFTSLLIPYIHLRLHGAAGDAGFLIAATGAGYLAGAPLGRALYQRLSLRLLTAAALLVTAAAFAAWFSVSYLGLALLLAALTGMSAMVFLVTRLTCLQQRTPDAVLGRTSAIFLAVEGAAGLSGTAIGGILIGLAGFRAAVATAAAAVACAAVISALLIPEASAPPRTWLPAEPPR
jgi:predicted MFS family arabinose efflux permease